MHGAGIFTHNTHTHTHTNETISQMKRFKSVLRFDLIQINPFTFLKVDLMANSLMYKMHQGFRSKHSV